MAFHQWQQVTQLSSALLLDPFYWQFWVSQPLQGALVCNFVDNFKLCYADEVSYCAACCACESVSVVQAAFSFHSRSRAQPRIVDGFLQDHCGRPSQQFRDELLVLSSSGLVIPAPGPYVCHLIGILLSLS